MKTDVNSEEKKRKKPYQTPALVCYGNILELTQTADCGGGVADSPTGCAGLAKFS